MIHPLDALQAGGGSVLAVAEFVPVLIMLVFAILFGAANLVLSFVLGKKGETNPVKEAAYECGMPPITDAHQRFSVKFYLVAVLFILFDIEAAFLIPWAVTFRDFAANRLFVLGEMGVFLGILVLGFVYLWKRGALEWD